MSVTPPIFAALLTSLAVVLFTANSILCRLALVQAGMDPQSFTIVRLVSGAAVLWLLTAGRRGQKGSIGGSFKAAAALLGYMLCFSFGYGYQGMGAASGTLILAAGLLLTTLVCARLLGEAITRYQLVGGVIAFAGLVTLVGPTLSRPPVFGSLLMAGAGASWVAYSALGKKSTDFALDTAGNFIRGLPVILVLLPFVRSVPLEGVVYAVLSGALASGLGYILWYRVVTLLSTITATFAQLSIPVVTAFSGWLLLGEPVTWRLFASGCAILLGILVAHMHSIRPAKHSG